MLAQAEAQTREAFAVYLDVAPKSSLVVQGLTQAFERSARKAGLVKMLGAPSWLRSVTSLAKVKADAFDPKLAGRRIGEALNASSPSLLLLNDLHNLVDAAEVDPCAKMLEEVAATIRPGVLVMFTCYASYLGWLTANQPGFVSRINRTMPLATLSDDEARLVIAKKLLAKRIVEELEPTYPFDRPAVRALNQAAHGNVRRLFELADNVLERAVTARSYQIDDELVRSTLVARDAPPPGAAPVWQETAEFPAETTGRTATDPTVPAAPRKRSLWGRT